MTPYYENPEFGVTLFRGDCLDIMPTLASGSVDAVAADLPYGTTACKWDTVIPFEPLWACYRRVTKPNAAIVLTASQPFTSALVMSNPKWFRYEWVWDKKKPTGMLNASRQPLRRHENVLVFYASAATYNPQKIDNPKGAEGRSFYTYKRSKEGGETVGAIKQGGVSSSYDATKLLPVSVQGFSKPHKPVHPTQKPVALMEYLIRTYTNEGDTVLDNTFGSGTTAVACVNTGRKFVGMELDADGKDYCQTAVERIEKAIAATKQPKQRELIA